MHHILIERQKDKIPYHHHHPYDTQYTKKTPTKRHIYRFSISLTTHLTVHLSLEVPTSLAHGPPTIRRFLVFYLSISAIVSFQCSRINCDSKNPISFEIYDDSHLPLADKWWIRWISTSGFFLCCSPHVCVCSVHASPSTLILHFSFVSCDLFRTAKHRHRLLLKLEIDVDFIDSDKLFRFPPFYFLFSS